MERPNFSNVGRKAVRERGKRGRGRNAVRDRDKGVGGGRQVEKREQVSKVKKGMLT